MKIGLFFGSFNPIHIGHLIIGNLVCQWTDVKEVWFVVSPQNPHKLNKNLLHEFDRLEMVERAIADEYHFRASDVEFNLPRPSYTINTLVHLTEKHPNNEFKLIIGEDNLASFPRWKNYERILEDYGLIVYPRPGAGESELKDHPNVQIIDAPEMDISASLMRKLVRENKSIKYLVPEGVERLIKQKGYFL